MDVHVLYVLELKISNKNFHLYGCKFVCVSCPDSQYLLKELAHPKKKLVSVFYV